MNSVFDALIHNPFGAASLLVAVTVLLVFQWWRQRKVFTYRVISDYPLVGVDKTISDRVKILFDDKPVDQVSLVVIEFRNSGWVPIEATDFHKRLGVDFGKDSKIMNVEKVEARPEDMDLISSFLDSSLAIEPTLFNRGDYVRLKLLVHHRGHITVSGRIKGVPRIKREGPGLGAHTIYPAFAFGVLFAMIFSVIYRNEMPYWSQSTRTWVLVSMFLPAFVVIVFILARAALRSLRRT